MFSNLIFVVLGLVGFLAVFGLGFALTGGGAAPSNKRVQAMAGGGKGERGRGGVRVNTPGETAAMRRKQILQNLKTADREQRKAKLSLDARIAQAGLSTPVRTFWIFSGGLGLVIGVLIMIVSHNPLIGLGAAFAGGLGLPRWFLGFRRKSRHKKFSAEFANSVDVIVRGIKSGLPVNDCLKVIATESPEPLATEFRKMVENIGMGLTMDQATEKMFNRMPTPEVRFFAIVLAIQQKTGGNLAEALNNLSMVLRARKLMVEKIKAMSSEAIASAAIIGVLPPGILLMVTVTTPSYMMPLYTTNTGHMALLIGVVMMVMGILVMRKMINFKF